MDAEEALRQVQDDNAALREDNRRLRDALAETNAAARQVASNAHINAVLATGEAKARAVLSSLAEGVVFLDRNGVVIEVNDAVQHVLGRTLQELTDPALDPRWRLIHADGTPFPVEEQPAIVVLRTGQSVRDVVMGVPQHDGTVTWISVNAQPVRDTAGELLGAVVSFFDITDRKRAEEALRESEQQLNTIVENLTEGLMVATIDGFLLRWNRAALAMHGFASLNEARHRLSEFIDVFEMSTLDGTVLPIDEWPLARVMRGDELHDWEVRIRRLHGDWQRIFSYSGTLVRGCEGQHLLAIITVSDITEHKRLEEQLRRRVEEVETLMEVAPVAIWICSDPRCHDITGNRMANTFYEAKAGENVSANVTGNRRFFQNGRELAADELPMQMAVARNSDVRNMEIDVQLPSGRWMTMLGSARPLRNTAGQVRGCVGAFVDMTERKQVEREREQLLVEVQRRSAEIQALNETLEHRVQRRTVELEETNRALQTTRDEAVKKAMESEEGRRILEALMTYIPEGITIADAPDVSIRMVSKYGQILTGKPREMLEGIPAEAQVESWDILKADGVTRPTADELPLTRAVKKGEVSIDEEWVVRQPDGRMISILTNAGPIRDKQGDIIGGVIAWRDITERRQAEQHINQLNRVLEQRTTALEAANKELEAFSYSVSHDLRAPLRSIDGFSKILIEQYPDRLDERGRDYLGRVRAASQRMARLIDDMLNLSRVGRAPLHREPVDLSALATAMLDELCQREPERRVEITILSGMVASGDPALLRMVLDNLLSNAWKFTSGCTVARIEVGEYMQDHERVFYVRDNGAGFDMTYVDRLFTPFQRLHTEQEFPGTGIGLAIVQRIINRHGGRVWAEGETGKGATIYFTLGEA